MNNKIKRLKVVYACNDKLFNPLYLSILSIIKRTKSPIDFYLFSANLKELKWKYISLTKKHELAIKRLINRYSPTSTFTIIDCKKNFYKRCNGRTPKTLHWTPYTTFRLLFDMFNWLKGTILYLDPDTLLCDDISKVFDVDMKKYELCVTKDIYPYVKRFDGRYFNAGVLLMNIDMIRKTQLFKRCFKYVLDQNPSFCDQDALNLLCTHIKYRVDDSYNRIWLTRKPTTVVKHFAGPCYKPWKRKFIKMSRKLNYDIWLSDIQEWKKMKSKI